MKNLNDLTKEERFNTFRSAFGSMVNVCIDSVLILRYIM